MNQTQDEIDSEAGNRKCLFFVAFLKLTVRHTPHVQSICSNTRGLVSF